MSNNWPYLIIGGGIAGITCAEILNHMDEHVPIGLITCTDTVKAVTNLRRITKLIEDFDVLEKSIEEISEKISNLTIIKGNVDFINSKSKSVILTDGNQVTYGQLCICTGGEPKLIYKDNPFVLGIRDSESVEIFRNKLTDYKRIAIIGNGGIATELAHEIIDCEVLWFVKDQNISANFFDSAAAKFILKSQTDEADEDKGAEKINIQRHHYNIDGKLFSTERKKFSSDSGKFGGALGPDWALSRTMKGCGTKRLEVHYSVEVVSIEIDKEKVLKLWKQQNSDDSHCDYNVALTTNDGSVSFCDIVVSATGVTPQYPTVIDAEWKISDKDGGILVNENMKTNLPGIYAAGDCCSANWESADLWFQMRLWNQARCMAFQAAKSMVASQNGEPDPFLDFSFELFTHVTKFFGYSVVLLGLYNGQKLQLENNPTAELWIRTSPGEEYIKCVVVNGRIKGAVLIGDTELAETLENLILDEIDVSQFGEHLLDPNVDIADYFD